MPAFLEALGEGGEGEKYKKPSKASLSHTAVTQP